MSSISFLKTTAFNKIHDSPWFLLYIFLDAIPQFAIVTAIDEILPPDGKLEDVYTCQRVKDFCSEVRDLLGITLSFIFPVSNYYEELEPSDVKNAMSLMVVWIVVANGHRYIMNKRQEIHELS